jgi:hypothetical protein
MYQPWQLSPLVALGIDMVAPAVLCNDARPHSNLRAIAMALTRQDEENYGPEFLDLTRRAAYDAVAPELAQLRQQNAQLREMAQRSQTANIQAALDRDLPQWRQVYANPEFSDWLQSPDPYAGEPRSYLLRRAVAAGDSNRVVRFYQGFLAEHGHAPAGQRSYQPRPAASSGNVYTRQQIANLYERRRKGEINDANWAKWEAEIFAAANQGRIAGALDRDGNKLTELR